MAKGLTDDELKALTDAEMRQSYAYWGGKLSEMRRKNEYYFLGLAKGDLSPPEIEGRSSVVDTTVRKTVLGMMAPLVKTFCGTENVVEFTPTEEGDEDKATQATDYVNYILNKQNPGYSLIHTWIHDALVQKAGIMKVWWDDSAIETREEYKGQTAEELALLLDDEEVEPIQHKSYPDEEAAEQKQQAIEHLTQQIEQMKAQGMDATPHPAMPAPGQAPAPMQPGQPPVAPPSPVQLAIQALQHAQAMPVPELHDVTVKRSKKGGRVRIENVPPEEFLINKNAKTIKDASFVGHRVIRTISDLTAAGYKNVDQISSDDTSAMLNAERIERAGYDDESPYLQDWQAGADPTMRRVWLTECYIKADVDGTGIAEWRKVVRAGNAILENVECDGPPFVSICPQPLPHRFFGLCPADLAMEPQRIQTSLLRAQLDNLYLQVNGRYFAVEGQVNLDDLLTSRPGGVVRMKQAGMAGRLDQSSGDTSHAMELLEFFQADAEEATGWTRQSQGGNGLQLNQTATQSNIITNRADSRIEIISRTFAETGFTDLFRMILKLVCQHQDREKTVKLGNKWATIDPREWTNQFDLTINVGLGTGNKDQQIQHLMALIQAQGAGLGIGITSPENMYHSHAKLASALGYKNADQFFTDPSAPPDTKNPPKPPQPNPDMLKIQAGSQAKAQEMQLKAQLDAQHLQLEMQAQQHKEQLQAAQVQAQQEAEAQRKKLELEQEAQLELIKQQYEQQKDAERRADERYKTELEAATKIMVAQIAAKGSLDEAAMAAMQSADSEVSESFSSEGDKLTPLMQMHGETLQALQGVMQHLARPKQIVVRPYRGKRCDRGLADCG